MLIYTFRGIVNQALTPERALQIGQAAASLLREQGQETILVAGDHRHSTEMLKHALKAGFLASGLTVIECGTMPTPILSNLVKRTALPGVMVTASHNPPEWNGFQFHEPDSHIYGPDEEAEIYRRIETGLSWPTWRAIGREEQREGVLEEYCQALAREVHLRRPLKVVVDSGNGTATLAVPLLLRQLGVDFHEIHAGLDPFFSHRPSEPNPEFLGRLAEEVVAREAEAGFAYDGDADRFVVLDERGQFIPGDKVLYWLCRFCCPPGPIALNVSVSLVIEQLLAQAGYEIHKARWGQTFIGDVMRMNEAGFGGEPDGHYLFPHLSLHADAVASTAFFCAALSTMDQPLSVLTEQLPYTAILREAIDWQDDLVHYTPLLTRFLSERYGGYRQLHERLFVSLTDHCKLVIRQSPFDTTLRLSAESPDPEQSRQMLEAVKALFLGS